jgi:hypothetical protein
MSGPKITPIAALAKCGVCGAPARLDHLRPDPVHPVDHFVYRCTSCSAFTIVERPRPVIGPEISDIPKTPDARKAV